MTEQVRVRFAPSPTGHLHIGNARTAIMNWIFARHSNGVFVLRVEDTDMERSSEASEKSILQDLRWLGLDWDEGPEVGGEYGPYRQSERLDLYKKYTEQLLKSGHAYHCYCTPEELDAEKKKALAAGAPVMYSGRCRTLTQEQKQRFEAEGRTPVVRMKYPEQPLSFTDLVKGELSFPPESNGDFVIVRADGVPTYNFAVVIDDGLMRISHVVRGDDHVSNTPRQLAVYHALGWNLPAFAHIPMILGPDRTRLSKRHGATSVDMYAQQGYLPEALINFLSLLGWSSESGDEILSLQRLIEEFDFSRVSKSPAIFDVEKLNWMNGVYIRETDPARLAELCLPYLKKAGYKLPEQPVLEKIVAAVAKSMERLEDVIARAELFFTDDIQPENEEAARFLNKETTQKVFWSFLRQLDRIEVLNADTFRKIMKTVGPETGVIGKDRWMPVRIALTGQAHGPELPAVVEIFGKQRCYRLIKSRIIE